jgi:hypothetical protein
MRKIIKIMIFVFAIFIALKLYFKVFDYKMDEGDTWKIFYELDKDSVDVIATGSSIVFGSVNPAILYNDYGIASYDLCGPGLSIPEEYYYLVEMFKTQSPKVILIDIMQTKCTTTVEHAYSAIGEMKFSLNKFQFAKNLQSDNVVGLMLKYPISHVRYDQDLYERDFLLYRGDVYHEYYKGNRVFWGTFEEYDEELYPYFSESIEPDEETIYWIDQIIKLASKNNTEIVFYIPPTYAEEELQKSANGICEYVKMKGYNVLNLNNLRDELNIDMKYDMNDARHVNYIGQQKTSKYIGEYILSNYELSDRRLDDNYYSWKMWAEDYYNSLEAFELSESDVELEEYINIIKDRDYSVLINVGGENTHMALDTHNILELMGIVVDTDEDFICWKDGDIVDTQMEVNKTFDFGRHTITLSEHGLLYDGTGIGFELDSISFALFDNKNKAIIEYRTYIYNTENGNWELLVKENWFQGVWNKR